MRDKGCGKVGRRAEAAFNMNMGVDQAWRNIGTVEINFLPGAIASAQTRNFAVGNGEIRRFDRARKDIDNAAIA